MKASIVDLRYKMKDVLKALRRRERVEILYHGKTAGIIIPPDIDKAKSKDLRNHAFFGMHKDLGHSISDIKGEIDKLRGPRYRDL